MRWFRRTVKFDTELWKETPEGTAFHLYYGDENAENIVQKTVYVDKVTEDSVMEQLAQALKLDSNIRLKKISFGMHGGDKVVMLDFNQAFADYMKKAEASPARQLSWEALPIRFWTVIRVSFCW